MSSKSLKELRAEKPAHLTVFWCDRCDKLINTNEDKTHFHAEQCGSCKKYRQIDSDYGYCSSHKSVYAGRKMFEHDTCSKWEKGKW